MEQLRPAKTVLFTAAPEDAGSRLGVFLRRQGVSLSLIRSLKYLPNGILHNGAPGRTNAILGEGDLVCLTLPPGSAYSAEPQNLPLEVLYHSGHALVLAKPAGMMMHPVGSRRQDTLANAFGGLAQRQSWVLPFRPVGRLDTGTSGLVLCALNAYAAPLLSKSLQKRYLALVQGGGLPTAGCIDVPLAAQPGSAIRQQAAPAGKASATQYNVLLSGPQAAVVWVAPLTGRTHQIRAHFAHIGHPLLGDALYGGSTEYIGRQALHCCEVEFEEPQGARQMFRLPWPQDMAQAVRKLGLYQNMPGFHSPLFEAYPCM